MLRSLLSVDVDTKALTYDAFSEQMAADLAKAKELKAPGAIALIRIDDFLEQDTLFESNPFPKVLKSIFQMIREEMTPLNILGRVDKKIFAIYFFNQNMAMRDQIKICNINNVEPSNESIYNREFIFTTEVYTVVRTNLEKNSTAYELWKWLQTVSGQKAIMESGYIPVRQE